MVLNYCIRVFVSYWQCFFYVLWQLICSADCIRQGIGLSLSVVGIRLNSWYDWVYENMLSINIQYVWNIISDSLIRFFVLCFVVLNLLMTKTAVVHYNKTDNTIYIFFFLHTIHHILYSIKVKIIDHIIDRLKPCSFMVIWQIINMPHTVSWYSLAWTPLSVFVFLVHKYAHTHKSNASE